MVVICPGLGVGLAVLLALTGCQHSSEAPVAGQAAAAAPIPVRAADVAPLRAGDRAPVALLRQPDGGLVDLAARYAGKPTVLVFYRGGWCPYCNTHLGEIAKIEPQLVALGYQVLAVSPDRPEALGVALDKGGYRYQLLSDSDMALARAFGLAFQVDEATVSKYRGYGIDLDAASGRSHHLLPVPAVYLVDRAGVIRFADWNPDYRVRLSGRDILAAARQAVGARPE